MDVCRLSLLWHLVAAQLRGAHTTERNFKLPGVLTGTKLTDEGGLLVLANKPWLFPDLESIPCLVIDYDADSEVLRRSLMQVRNVLVVTSEVPNQVLDRFPTEKCYLFVLPTSKSSLKFIAQSKRFMDFACASYYKPWNATNHFWTRRGFFSRKMRLVFEPSCCATALGSDVLYLCIYILLDFWTPRLSHRGSRPTPSSTTENDLMEAKQ